MAKRNVNDYKGFDSSSISPSESSSKGNEGSVLEHSQVHDEHDVLKSRYEFLKPHLDAEWYERQGLGKKLDTPSFDSVSSVVTSGNSGSAKVNEFGEIVRDGAFFFENEKLEDVPTFTPPSSDSKKLSDIPQASSLISPTPLGPATPGMAQPKPLPNYDSTRYQKAEPLPFRIPPTEESKLEKRKTLDMMRHNLQTKEMMENHKGGAGALNHADRVAQAEALSDGIVKPSKESSLDLTK